MILCILADVHLQIITMRMVHFWFKWLVLKLDYSVKLWSGNANSQIKLNFHWVFSAIAYRHGHGCWDRRLQVDSEVQKYQTLHDYLPRPVIMPVLSGD